MVFTSRDQDWINSRNAIDTSGTTKGFKLDVTSEADFASVVAALQHQHPEFRPNVVINATGLLHDAGAGVRPETSIKQLNADTFRKSFDVNVLGNFLTVRYFLAGLADRQADAGVFATLSARVGSISDNAAGGWHSYRCGKVFYCHSRTTWRLRM